MSKSSKILVGFLSFLPVIMVGGFIILMFLFFNRMVEFRSYDPEPSEMFSMVGRIFIAEIIVFLISIGVLLFFIIHLSRNKGMESTEKAIWVLALVLGSVICYPIYWYMKIWKEELPAGA